MQMIRRKFPITVFKCTLGQGLSKFKAKADDLKLYWKEKFGGKPNEAWKITKERLMQHWGITNQVYLVREDFNFTIPFALAHTALQPSKLCRNCIIMIEKTIKAVISTHDKKPKNFKFDPDELIDTGMIDVSQLCSTCKSKLYTVSNKNLKDYLCQDCVSTLPNAITVDFETTDELKGSSTEAHEQRKNEEFVRTVANESKKIRRSDIIYGFIMALPIGAILMLGVLIASGVIKLI